MRRIKNTALSIAFAIFCVGCQTPRPPAQAPKTAPPAENSETARVRQETGAGDSAKSDFGELDRALAFFDRIRILDATRILEELASARRSFTADPSDLNRVQLAMTMTLGATGQRDDEAILDLLLPMVGDETKEKSPLRVLANLLHFEIAEHRRIGEILRQQASKLKEENKRNDLLQQKLNALLEMEKSIIERELLPPESRN